MNDSLRPPPYASAVSNAVIPASQAASMSACASPSVSPAPKCTVDEPRPPKLPQPRTIRDTSTPLRPRARCSMRWRLVSFAPLPRAVGTLQHLERLFGAALLLQECAEPFVDVADVVVRLTLEQLGGELPDLARAGVVADLAVDVAEDGVGADRKST